MGNANRRPAKNSTPPGLELEAMALIRARQTKFKVLPDDLLEYIAEYLGAGDLARLARTHIHAYCLFKPKLDAGRVGHFVAKGRQQLVETFLKRIALAELGNILTAKISILDPAGHHLDKVTVFQYALWARDRHMWDMLLLFFNKAFPERGYGIAYQQLLELNTTSAAHGAHFDFKPLQTAYADYHAEAKKGSQCDKTRLQSLFMKIGAAQTKLVMHIVNEYCREDRHFGFPNRPPSFNEPTLPRESTVKDEAEAVSVRTRIASGRCVPIIQWYSLKTLGKTSAIFRANYSVVSTAKTALIHSILIDEEAINELITVREADFQSLELRLQSQPAPKALGL